MAVSRTLIRAAGLKGSPASECMHYVNNLLCRESVSSMFVTVFYGILNTFTGEVEYVNAGHNPPYLLSSSGLHKSDLTMELPWVLQEDISFKSKTIKMKPGDKLFLYTDGVTEAFNNELIAYGEDKLKIFLDHRLALPIETIIKESLEDVNAFVNGASRSDDITLLAIAFNG